MEWVALIILIVIGLILLMLEFLVFPGVQITGIVGFVAIAVGIFWAYSAYGFSGGTLVLGGTVIAGGLLTWYVLQTKTWKRMGLSARIDSKVEGTDVTIKPGDEGYALGRLAPMGKIRIGDTIAVGESVSGYVKEGEGIVVVKVLPNKVIVKLK